MVVLLEDHVEILRVFVVQCLNFPILAYVVLKGRGYVGRQDSKGMVQGSDVLG